MSENLRELSKCILFNNISDSEIESIFYDINPRMENFKSDTPVAFEGDECNSIGIVLDGKIEIQKNYPSGKVVTLTSLNRGNIFGEVIVFSNKGSYPSDVMAVDESKVMFISREEIIELCSKNKAFLENFMSLLSNKILLLNSKVRELSFESIRQKVCNFLIVEYEKQKNLILHVELSRKTMAEHMGIQRPSLSRELINMRDEGLIDFEKNIIKINDLETIKEFL